MCSSLSCAHGRTVGAVSFSNRVLGKFLSEFFCTFFLHNPLTALNKASKIHQKKKKKKKNKASKQTVEPLSTQNAIFTKDHVEIVSELFA